MTMGLIERGSEVVVDSLATELSKTHEVLVLQSGKVDKKSYKVKQIPGLSEVPQSAPTTLIEKIAFRLHVDSESGAVVQFTNSAEVSLRNFAPDIIVAINGPLQIRLLKKMALTAKIVSFGHAGIGHHDRDTLRQSPDLFVALSHSAKSWAEKVAAKNTKVVYIPNPFDPTPFSKAKAMDVGMLPPVVMVTSSLSPHKNVGLVVEAVSDLGASLLLIGDGENHAEIESLLAEYPTQFRWIKQVDHSDMAAYYKSANVFCLVPDSQEAFGMVYLEAMAAGLPIVATDDEIRRSIVGKQCIYVDPQSESALSEAILQATKLGRINYKAELKPYSLPSVVKLIEENFYALIS
jgi:glycosyltransferase involved in cell wall biosynthesis